MTDKIIKAFSVVSKAIDLEAGIFETMISTEAVDRQGDIVRATGARLENYLKNPVVLWAHDYSQPPIAKALGIEILPGSGLKSRFQFSEWNINPQADVVRRLWASGFLNATSIGFIPLKSKALNEEDEDYWWGPRDYVEWELLEYSIVPVPANQEALRLAMKSLATKTPFLQKRGRVLSAANEKKLKDAAAAITDVLSQLGEEEEDPDKQLPAQADTEPSNVESNTDPTSNDVDEAVLEKIGNLFSEIFEVKL
jgi:HK97 family phage prohead protease